MEEIIGYQPLVDEIKFSGEQPTLKEAKIAKNYLDEKELRAMGLLSGYTIVFNNVREKIYEFVA